MVAAVVDLIGSSAIEQNSLWESKITYPGNVVGLRFKGQIKKDYNSKPLADFRFGLGVYDAVNDETNFDWFLPSSVTKTLPATKPAEYFVYDVVVYFLNQNEPRRQLKGIVEISAGSTET